MPSRRTSLTFLGCLALLAPAAGRAAAPPVPPAEPLPPGAVARLGTTRFRSALSLPFSLSPDGKILALSEPGRVRLLDPLTWRELRRFVHPYGEARFGFTGDGRLLRGGGDSDITYFWDPATGKRVRRFRYPPGITGGGFFSPDGAVYVTVREGKGHDEHAVELWDTAAGKELDSFEPALALGLGVALSADKKTLASWGSGAWGRLQFWDVDSGTELRRGVVRGGPDYPGAFSPDGKTLAVALEGAVGLFDVASARERRRLPLRGKERCWGVEFSPDGKLLAAVAGDLTTGDYDVHLWEAATGKSLGVCRLRGCWGVDLAFPRGGKVLAWGVCGQTFSLWEVPSGKLLTPRQGHLHGVRGVCFSPDGRQVRSASAEGALCSWDASTGRLLGQDSLRGERGGRLSWHFDGTFLFSPDGKRLAACDKHARRFSVWGASGGRPVRAFAAQGDPLPAPAWSADGRRLAFGNKSGAVGLWDVSAGRKAGAWEVEELRAVALSPDGARVAAARHVGGVSDPDEVRVWEAATGQTVCRFSVKASWVERLAFSPDGRLLAAADSHEWVRLFDSASGRELLALGGKRAGWVDTPLTFSPDGRALAFGCRGDLEGPGRVQVWEVASGGLRRQFAGQGGVIHTVAFSPDGKALASGADDTTVVVWDLGARRAGGRLAPEEQDRLWRDLSSPDATTGYRAVLRLSAHPEEAVGLVRKRLRPAPGKGEARRIARLVQELDDDDFGVRQRATRELRRVGKEAVPALEKALREGPSPEVRARAGRLLRELTAPGPDPGLLRPLRAVEVLERVATPDARLLLGALAAGRPDAALTQEAKGALRRLAGRTAGR